MPKTTLNSRERMVAALTRQRPDHVPFSPFIPQGPWWPAPLFWRDPIERMDRMLELGLDPTFDIWLPWPSLHPEVTIKTWRDTSGSEPLLTCEYHTPAGVLRQTVRETSDWCNALHVPWTPTIFGVERRDHFNMDLLDDWNVSRRTEPWIKRPQDLEKLKYLIGLPQGHRLDQWRMDAQRAIELAKRRGVLTVARRTIVGDAFQWLCNINDFLVWMIEEPEFVRSFLQVFQEWSLALTRLALEAGVDVVQRRGWYEIPTYWGVNLFQKFLVPLIEEETRLVHQAGKLHCYLLPEGQGAYADILKTMGMDVLMGVDPRMLHGGDLKSLYQKLGAEKSFWGGVNAEVTLTSENPLKIEMAVHQAIEDLGGNGGLILGSFLFQQVTSRSILQLIDAWKKHC